MQENNKEAGRWVIYPIGNKFAELTEDYDALSNAGIEIGDIDRLLKDSQDKKAFSITITALMGPGFNYKDNPEQRQALLDLSIKVNRCN